MSESAFDIFDRFSQSARNVLINAEQIARGMDRPVSSEHILLALCTTRNTLSYDILKSNMISADQIRLVLNVKPSSRGNVQGLADEGRTILKRSALIAASYKHLSIDAEHLLMSCVTGTSLQSRKIIIQLGADPEKIKKQLADLFSDLSEMDKLIRDKVGDSSTPSLEGVIDGLNEGNRPSKSKTPAIDMFTTDMTAQAKKNELDTVIGRQKEIGRALQILLRRTKNNPVLVGEPGVGKTAIAEGIAQMISSGNVPSVLSEKKVLSLDLPQVVAGTVYRGQFEERIKKLITEINAQKNIILFIDEIHNIVGAGSAEGSIDAANIIKPALSRGNIRVIGATTHEEYRKFLEKDSALERRLQKIIVREPSVAESIEMLKGLRHKYEQYHNVKITDDAIEAACELADRFIHDRNLPDKAIDLIDEAAAAQTINRKTPKVKSNAAIVSELSEKRQKAILGEKYDLALSIDKKIKKLTQAPKQTAIKLISQTITRKDIVATVEQWTGIPIKSSGDRDMSDIEGIEQKLKNKIIGQDEAIAEIASALKRSRIGIADEKKPIGSFIFLGPTGVGKTLLASEIAYEIFGTRKALIKIDMSEFMERHNISRLIGAPPGYVGYEEAGKLTEAVRNQPYSVILFDEIEKAHPDVFNMLLQIMEDGYLTDAQGRRVNFCHSLIILTSNIGTRNIGKNNIGFSPQNWGENYEKIKEKLTKSLDQQVSPEFINRLDSIIVFKPLDEKSIIAIAGKEVSLLVARLKKSSNIDVMVSATVIKQIAQSGANNKFGARPIKRAIQCLIEDKIADYLIHGGEKKKIYVDYIRGNVVVDSKAFKRS